MRNVKMTVDKSGKLIIEVDLKAETVPSNTGKTQVIGGTEGSQKVDGHDATVNLTVYRKNAAAPTKV